MQSIEFVCPKKDTPFGKIFYPGLTAELLLEMGEYQAFEFILDSGAGCTILPNYVARLTGNHLPKEPDEHLMGVAGIKQACYKGKVSMRIGKKEFQIRCLFTDSNTTPFLIGRVDFFTIFNIFFDANNCKIVLTTQQ